MHYIIALHCEYLRNWVGRISTNKTLTLTQRDSDTLWRRNSTQIYIFSLQMCIPTVSLYVSSYVGFKLGHYSFKVEKRRNQTVDYYYVFVDDHARLRHVVRRAISCAVA